MSKYAKVRIRDAITNAIVAGACIFLIFYFKLPGWLFIICVVIGWAALIYCLKAATAAWKEIQETKNKQ